MVDDVDGNGVVVMVKGGSSRRWWRRRRRDINYLNRKKNFFFVFYDGGKKKDKEKDQCVCVCVSVCFEKEKTNQRKATEKGQNEPREIRKKRFSINFFLSFWIDDICKKKTNFFSIRIHRIILLMIRIDCNDNNRLFNQTIVYMVLYVKFFSFHFPSLCFRSLSPG